MPTFSFPVVPLLLTKQLRHDWNAPLPNHDDSHEYHSFGSMLDARLLSTPDRSTSELLRTL